ncbi:UDP-N-acetylmuramoyl-L-alanine--D-glutamate ligase [Reyranella sp. MMS21-HV4-11]|uniref:UDP-N-acetylmuramoylalanine--D-glutamate ligase n=1 Tax=Reyranella humidisoli TaxID=2849149 RepID=A0ABS6IN10_9HYPH|nr:UDP-N-acetylmuramoyl-L-alanine--D-glutamate ligase [Reyranella sp. MMS21-HV4-11]MBU8875978.1 UDP-N-acetylmuramoyl-L-alanine--D-glutamate ligase [Reyranella sp. MMS21-HV4-11]
MIDLAVLKGSSFVVLGLARSGLATVRALRAAGIACVAWDDNAASRDAAVQAGARVADPATIDWSGITALVISPGIPSTLPVPHPVAVAARAAGKPIICDVELLARAQPEATFVAITGTNGKSTTTALIGHILQQAGLRCQVGGNIGRGALDLDPLGKGGLYVLELSSYQLELLQTFRADIAVWLNITPDHIDRHGDIPGYVAAKRNIFQRQRAGDCAVIGIEDEPSREIEREIAARPGIACIPVALDRPVANGISYRAGVLVDADGYTVDFADVLTLPGDHNGQNAACAWAVCRWLDLPREAIVAGMKTYAGLPHRQERVAAVGNIVYINDSKATNADATARALSSYDDIYWILGGQAKEGGVAPLASYFDRIRHAFLIGEATELFAGQFEGKLPYSRCGDLQSALDAAHALAQREAQGEGKGPAVVLLSPACASWDQWKSYEHRGDAFRAMARALPGAEILGRAA